jgi:lactate permease
MTPWAQNSDPLGNVVLSTIAAAVPVITLFFFLAVRRTPAWLAAIYGFVAAVAVALLVYRMPPGMVAGAVATGMTFGWFRIAWILVASVFVYDISVESGKFELIKQSISGISTDRRLQALLIAFAFGSLLEGAGGGGAPVAVSAAMMMGLGFPPFETALMCLIGNSAPVAFGGLGNPVRTLVAVTGLPEADFSAMLGRILPLTVLILPFWMVRVMCSTSAVFRVWPGLLACGVIFGAIQWIWANYMGPTLASVTAAIVTLIVLALYFRLVWHPKEIWHFPNEPVVQKSTTKFTVGKLVMAWSPFLLLTFFVVIWGLGPVVKTLDVVSWQPPVPGLHNMVLRMPPVVPQPRPEPAILDVSWLSTPGTGVFIAGLIAGPLVGLSFRKTLKVFWMSMWKLRLSLLSIMAMLAVGYITRYCGMDVTLGLALSHSGLLFPFFGTLIGWIGVALSGTDAGSNALFGSFQAITATKLGLSPILMGAANSAGGVMGKMIATQSLVIACAATGQEGKEGTLFRAILKHSLLGAIIVGLIVMFFAYVIPGAIPSGHHYW